ncbi:MAG: hypothetical protein RMN51_12990 [Verrucomicrobiota bacterium]|nr:hypothetical protein [Limisphaera sp.]MDW8383010.1 hypothetical protein [Verrucomicrobiota bacterium]
MLNGGLVDGSHSRFGALTNTNRRTARSTSAGYNLAIGDYHQESGLERAGISGASGTMNIRGDGLRGANTFTRPAFNAAAHRPGNPFGLLSTTGNLSNANPGKKCPSIQGVGVWAVPFRQSTSSEPTRFRVHAWFSSPTDSSWLLAIFSVG